MTDRATTADECIRIVIEMIEEAQREARYTIQGQHKQQLAAKTHALIEAKNRIRGERRDHYWARRELPMPL